MPVQPGRPGNSKVEGAAGRADVTRYKLGKSPALFDARTLRFGDYLSPQLPSPPPAVDHGAKVSRWSLYDNDRFANCTSAAAAHMIQCWSASVGAEVSVPLSAVLAFYRDGGGPDSSPDANCSLLSVLKRWQSRGLGSHKIVAFAQLEPNNRTQVEDAVYLFGSACLGIALPDFAVEGDRLSKPWVVPPQGPVAKAAANTGNGHCVPVVAYDARNLYVVTWGQMRAMSWPFYDAYVDEAYVALSPDWIDTNGATVAGFDLAGLRRDVRRVQTIPRERAAVKREPAMAADVDVRVEGQHASVDREKRRENHL
jgi:hypothetical protein